jgi:DNA repair protein RadC
MEYGKQKKSSLNSGHRKRLRDRFQNASLRSLPDYEILEMVLYLAIIRGDTKKIAKELLIKFRSLAGIIGSEAKDLRQIDGVGESVIFLLKLLADLNSRLHIPIKPKEFHILGNFTSVINYCDLTMGHKNKEFFRVLYLNKKNALIEDHIHEEGTVDQIQIYPREITRKVLDTGASSIVLIHNHPSGDTTPSKEDIEVTKAIKQALVLFNVGVHDHIIVSRGEYFSFRSNGLL